MIHGGSEREREAWPPFLSGKGRLEEGGGTPLPGLALFFCRFFYVVHVGTGLGQKMMKVVANAEEREPLFQKLSYASSAEKKKTENDFVLSGVLDEFLRGCSQLRRRVHVGKLVFLEEAHRHTQVVLA